MPRGDEPEPWPPPDALAYLRAEAFGALALEIVRDLTVKYPRMDFTDAVATVFVWLERRVRAEPAFLGAGRFRTPGAFRAYLRQAFWNSARAVHRRRTLLHEQSIPEGDAELVSTALSPETLAAFHECHDRLPARPRAVFDLLQDRDEPPAGMTRDQWAAATLGCSLSTVHRNYRVACDLIWRCMHGRAPQDDPG